MSYGLWTNEWDTTHWEKSEWDDAWVPKKENDWYTGGTYAPDIKKTTHRVERTESRGCSECSGAGTVMQTIDGNTFPVPCKRCGGEGHIDVLIREDIMENNTLEELKKSHHELEMAMKALRYGA